MLMTGLLLAVSVAGTQVVSADSADAYVKEIEAWRAARQERLKSPSGWLSLVGLDWLKPGVNTIGSGKGNDIVIAKAPPRLGSIEWNKDTVRLTLNDGSVGGC